MIFDSAEWGVLVEKANKHLSHLQQWNLNITKNKNLTKNCWQKKNEKIVSSNHPFNRRWEPCPIWQEQGHCYTKSWSVPCLAKQLLRSQQTHKNPLLDLFIHSFMYMPILHLIHLRAYLRPTPRWLVKQYISIIFCFCQSKIYLHKQEKFISCLCVHSFCVSFLV